jgi:hypothetical protein
LTHEIFALIIAVTLLTLTTAPSLAQNNTDGNGTMTSDNTTAKDGGANATEANQSGSISSFHSYCPFSFC